MSEMLKRGIPCLICFAPGLSLTRAYCEEPTSAACSSTCVVPGIPDAQLKQVQVVARHGARTTFSHEFPLKNVTWDMCDLVSKAVPVMVRNLDGGESPFSHVNERQVKQKMPGGCHTGQLTTTGFQQAVDLGKWLREQYVIQHGLLPTELDPSTLAIRTTNIARTILTAKGILTGLYPAAAVEQSKQESIQQDQYVIMYTASDEKEWLHPNYKHCQRFMEMFQEGREAFVADTELNATLRGLDPASREGAGGKEKKQGLREWHDLLPSLVAHELPLPVGVDEKLLKRIEQEGLKMMSTFLTSGGQVNSERRTEGLHLAVGLLVQDITGILEASAAGKHAPLFKLYSAHDTTILPLLLVLGVQREEWPPFASSLVFELWYSPDREQHFVRIIFNKEVLELEGCSDGLCSLSHFNKMLRPYIPLDWADSCKSKNLV